jgi:hypothetical protein
MNIHYPIHPNALTAARLNELTLYPAKEAVSNPYFPQFGEARVKVLQSIRIVDIDNAAIDSQIVVKKAIQKMMEKEAPSNG